MASTREAQIYFAITGFVVVVSELLSRIIVIRPRIQVSQISAISAMQIWYWILILLFIAFSLVLHFIGKIDPKQIITILLHFSIAINVTFIVSATRLALSKVPLPPGDIRGDNGTLLEYMLDAYYWGWAPNHYPPVWPNLVGNIARLTDTSVLEIWKPAYLVSLVVLPGLILLIFRQAFNPLLAAALTFVLTLGVIEWSSFAKIAFIGLFIVVAQRILHEVSSTYKFDSRIFLYGSLFGLSALTYFGFLWWSLIAITILVVPIWLLKNREFIFIRILDASLGFLVTFGPSQLGQRLDISFRTELVLILSLIVLRLLSQRNRFISGVIAYTTGIFIIFTPVFIIALTTIKDSWIYDSLENNPTPNLGIEFNIIGLITYLVLIIGLVLAFKNTQLRIALVVLVAIFMSAAIMMFWFAARLEVTGFVELFPRARGNFNLSWAIITYIGIYTLVVESDLTSYIRKIWPRNLLKSSQILLILILLFPVAAVHARALSNTQDEIFPVGENEIWLAYRACDNPAEDPMLAKVFEEKPFVQDFLRENCPNVDWPVIPPINQVE